MAILGATLLQAPDTPRWTPQTSGVTARFRGVSAVNERVAWASGADGTIVRTVDGGRTWQKLPAPRPEAAPPAPAASVPATFDFRDIDAIDERTAYALSIGPGEASRIVKTVDGGQHWETQFINRDPKAFFDATAFWDADRGIAISDSVDGAFVIRLTRDGGRTWTPASPAHLPPALPNEGAFAASGTNVAVHGTDHVWIGTGAAATARVLRSTDGGRTWTVSNTPLRAGPSAGIFSIAFRDPLHGIIVGGDYKNEAAAIDNMALTNDGGATWTPIREHGLSGFRSVVAYVPLAAQTPSSSSSAPAPASAPASAPRSSPSSRPSPALSSALIAIGPSGADMSTDDGRTWRPIECGAGFHAFSFAPPTAARTIVGWAVGEQGRIARLEWPIQGEAARE